MLRISIQAHLRPSRPEERPIFISPKAPHDAPLPLVTGDSRTPSDPHHLRFAQPRALGRKVSDGLTVPLRRTHHREIHRIGDERAWWTVNRLDPRSCGGGHIRCHAAQLIPCQRFRAARYELA
jgi:hypothetical protein